MERERRLACAVRAEQCNLFLRMDMQVDVNERRGPIRVCERQSSNGDGRGAQCGLLLQTVRAQAR